MYAQTSSTTTRISELLPQTFGTNEYTPHDMIILYLNKIYDKIDSIRDFILASNFKYKDVN